MDHFTSQSEPTQNTLPATRRLFSLHPWSVFIISSRLLLFSLNDARLFTSLPIIYPVSDAFYFLHFIPLNTNSSNLISINRCIIISFLKLQKVTFIVSKITTRRVLLVQPTLDKRRVCVQYIHVVWLGWCSHRCFRFCCVCNVSPTKTSIMTLMMMIYLVLIYICVISSALHTWFFHATYYMYHVANFTSKTLCGFSIGKNVNIRKYVRIYE